MNEQALQDYLLTHFPKEGDACEWKEFKNLTHAVSGRKGDDIASYVSAIANMEGGHLVVGVEDGTLKIVGIQNLADYTPENLRQRLLGRCTNLDSEGFRVEPFLTDDTRKTVWVLHIPKHKPRLPVYAHDKAWQRLDDSLVEMRSERLDAILGESVDVVDWSAQVVPAAMPADLDLGALVLARQKFKERHPTAAFFDQIDSWSTEVFLDRAKLTANGQLTRAALLLLGGPSAVHLLSPHPAQITWKLETEERSYEHFGPPFLLTTTQVLQRIRNIKQRLFPANQLLATEVLKYDTRVILEALHNCLAHQDYTRQSRVLVTEKVDRLIFENAGGFFEGHAEDYFTGERTPSRYRNPWLAQAMVQLGMIDTMGYGIHAMTLAQRQRYFPLPDYGRSSANSVVLEIFGHTLDENYSLLLLEKQDLDIATVILLDRVQKRLPIPDSVAAYLRRQGLIEGRKPNFYLSASVAESTNEQATYTRNKGLEKEQLKQFVLSHLRQFQPISRKKLADLLIPMLPDGLTDQQKIDRVRNLLAEMRARDGTVCSEGKGPTAVWRLRSRVG
ncbi:RNA-binding domain-containing protein [Azospira restricta]|uniref:DNA binding domain-containing protein n=1 Tax=Azospira restricta TaxID=404405 RepID=A0A974PXP6_9RHOO|nr:RNA-binding domain-containing protein [Azospira restricta]QRJ63048.1 putative DNA binding domain-containing protein [Azospira restricta]